jgi:hypothetical protein
VSPFLLSLRKVLHTHIYIYFLAGKRLLSKMKNMGATNVVMCVTRWYGGVNLGKARFEHIQSCCMNLLQALGHQQNEGIVHMWGQGHVLASSSAAQQREKDTPAKRRALAAEAAERRFSSSSPHITSKRQKKVASVCIPVPSPKDTLSPKELHPHPRHDGVLAQEKKETLPRPGDKFDNRDVVCIDASIIDLT